MKNIRPTQSYRLFVMIAILTMLMPLYAQNSDNASQALQQLRLLQQKLSKESSAAPGNNAPANNQQSSAPPQVTSPSASSNNQPKNPPQSQSNATVIASQSVEDIIDEKAFEELQKQLFPLSSAQIHQLKKRYEQKEFANAASAGTPPKPVATSLFVNLSPGSTPPAIRLSQGFISSLVFLDSSGAPWPISAYDLGDPNAFNIQWDKQSNTLMIQSLKLYTYGNLAIRLRGLNTPVMLTLVPGQKEVDYRIDLRVQGYGPNAINLPMGDGLPPHANDLLLHVLDGVPPQGSQRLIVSGGDARAWLYRDKMYVRTNLTVLSPGWLSSMTSADGTHAYEMQKAPIILVSWHGKVMHLKIEGL